jgi:hypothetical protein
MSTLNPEENNNEVRIKVFTELKKGTLMEKPEELCL